MRLLRKRAFARAGLIGNPSDGFFGRTISLIVRNVFAEVVLYEWPQVEIIWSQEDHSRFDSISDLSRDVELHGYYGGIRLVKATIKKFVEFCERQSWTLHDRNFSIRYESNIPRSVGLAGSSAIIVATMRALMEWYDVDIPQDVQPSLALSVETDELGIAGGLQDRVIQVYEGLVFMDFARERMQEKQGLTCGVYARLDAAALPLLYIAYNSDAAEPTEIIHAPLRVRFEQGHEPVVSAMARLAELTLEAREALETGRANRLSQLIDENFDIRRSICDLSQDHLRMVETARNTGASAKFAGSGGAIIGTYRDEAMFAALKDNLQNIGCRVIKPVVEDV